MGENGSEWERIGENGREWERIGENGIEIKKSIQMVNIHNHIFFSLFHI
jgi:hypothetical protein